MLTEGLKSCRAVMNSYRSLLASEPHAQTAAAENDAGMIEHGAGSDLPDEHQSAASALRG